ncbi:hypothetical protein BV22DRAFT_1048508 [Leucogyrophana mollusca]|uniref:Uncharacterized protein n=1 Tax=Leucogyrophana mollusca TaxID=85980 RepID=A0ACB8BB06_9AGAM|nr:hypothetical protein BV22DRAFT_1048508 [Leucogyrophana mollusca]
MISVSVNNKVDITSTSLHNTGILDPTQVVVMLANSWDGEMGMSDIRQYNLIKGDVVASANSPSLPRHPAVPALSPSELVPFVVLTPANHPRIHTPTTTTVTMFSKAFILGLAALASAECHRSATSSEGYTIDFYSAKGCGGHHSRVHHVPKARSGHVAPCGKGTLIDPKIRGNLHSVIFTGSKYYGFGLYKDCDYYPLYAQDGSNVVNSTEYPLDTATHYDVYKYGELPTTE